MGRARKNPRSAAPSRMLAVSHAVRCAAELGVSTDAVEDAFATVCAEVDCIPGADGFVYLSEAGFEKIREHITAQMRPQPDAAPIAPPALSEAPQSTLHREDLRLTRVFRWSNNVLAERSNGLEVVLAVRSNRHLEPGMILKGCIQDQMGWTYDGRLPRVLGERQLFFPSPK